MSALKVGEKAPEFSLLNQDGVEISLKDFLGKKVVLYFYPKDNTPGCTTQACEYSAFFDKFNQKDAVIIGISPDSPKSHEKFIDKFKLKHILLCDTDKEVAKAYGAFGAKKLYGKEYEGIIRSSFLIDEKGKIAQIHLNVKAKDNAKSMLEEL